MSVKNKYGVVTPMIQLVSAVILLVLCWIAVFEGQIYKFKHVANVNYYVSSGYRVFVTIFCMLIGPVYLYLYAWKIKYNNDELIITKLFGYKKEIVKKSDIHKIKIVKYKYGIRIILESGNVCNIESFCNNYSGFMKYLDKFNINSIEPNNHL